MNPGQEPLVVVQGATLAYRGNLVLRAVDCRIEAGETLGAMAAALRDAGLTFEFDPTDEQARRIVSVFAKAEASPTGTIRGRRNTMLSDADINYERHARAAVGAVIASVTRDPAIFVSGGTEHQCAPGMAPIAAIVRA